MNETLKNQARVLSTAELERHAEVSRRHRCRCNDCFCCAALAEQDARAKSGSLFLIEFYTTDPRTGESGWDINFAWVFATDKHAARLLLADRQGKRFGEVITCEQQSSITPLAGEFRVNTPDANLFIYR